MDWITILGIIGSIITIIAFILQLLNKEKSYDNNKGFNTNSFNRKSVTYNIHINESANKDNRERHSLRNQNNSQTKQCSGSNDSGGMFLIIVILIGLMLILKFYTNYKFEIVLSLIVMGIIGVFINIIIIWIVGKYEKIPNTYVYYNIGKWFPLFLLLIFIYHPLYASENLVYVESQLKEGVGFLSLLWNHSQDIFFYFLQFIGLMFIFGFMIWSIIKSLYNIYKYYNIDYINFNCINRDKILGYVILNLLIFMFISGLYLEIFASQEQILDFNQILQ